MDCLMRLKHIRLIYKLDIINLARKYKAYLKLLKLDNKN